MAIVRGQEVRATGEKLRTRRKKPKVFAHAVIIFIGILMIYPLLWMVSSSFKPEGLIFSQPGLWPTDASFKNFINGWNALGIPFSAFFINSFIVAGLAVIGNIFSCSLAAYVFARLDFRFRKSLFAIMVATIMLPFQVVIVPQYILFHDLNWLNTFLPLVVPKFLGVDAFFIFLMVQFIRGIPRDLDEAATVDGCGPIGVFWRILLPLMRPAIAVTAVFTFIWTWNDFLAPLLYLNKPSLYTMPVALNAFLNSSGVSAYGPMMAMSLLSLLPLFVVFILAQKQLIEGIATTGIK